MEARPGTTTVQRTRCNHQPGLVPDKAMAIELVDLVSLSAMVSVTVNVTVVLMEAPVHLASASLRACWVQVEMPPCGTAGLGPAGPGSTPSQTASLPPDPAGWSEKAVTT